MERIIKLYEMYRQDVYRYLVSLCRDASLAEELVSETYFAALLSLPGYRGDGDIKTWLFTIARRKWIDYLRKKSPEQTVELSQISHLADPAPGPEELAILRQMNERVHKLLETEDERARTVVMRRLEGYSYYEIARELGIREGSARVIDFRVKQKIKSKLQEEGYDEGF